MKFAAVVLVLMLLPEELPRPRVEPAVAPPMAPSTPLGTSPTLAASQEWLGDPVLPKLFVSPSEPGEAEEREFSLEMPPLRTFMLPLRQDDPPRRETPTQEPSFPRGVGAPEVKAW